jgi:hypothetical protein
VANTELFLTADAVRLVFNTPSIDTLALALFCADTDIDAVVPKFVDPTNVGVALTTIEVVDAIATEADCILCAVVVIEVAESTSKLAFAVLDADAVSVVSLLIDTLAEVILLAFVSNVVATDDDTVALAILVAFTS